MANMIKVGCCGTSGLSLKEYSKRYRVLEVQRSFYELLGEDLGKKWRDSVPPDFEFTIKVFQGVTHPAESPTWRRSVKVLQGIDPRDVGMLKRTSFVKMCWDKSINFAKALKSKVIVIQLPPSYKYNEKNFNGIKSFFKFVEPEITCAIEFRHDSWLNKLTDVTDLLKSWDIIIVSDPLKFNVPAQKTQYFRLHGMNGFVNYRHVYTDEEIDKLAKETRKYAAYVLFNNLSMLKDADRFIARLNKLT